MKYVLKVIFLIYKIYDLNWSWDLGGYDFSEILNHGWNYDLCWNYDQGENCDLDRNYDQDRNYDLGGSCDTIELCDYKGYGDLMRHCDLMRYCHFNCSWEPYEFLNLAKNWDLIGNFQ